MSGSRRAIFCDRDGTLIRDLGYLRDPAGVEILPGATAALAEATRRGFTIVVISNQSGVGRGLISESEFRAVDRAFQDAFAAEGITLGGVYYCVHSPDAGCGCRKPRPGLIEEAVRELGVDPRLSVMFGDKPSDVEAGSLAGCRTVLFGVDRAPALEGVRADLCIPTWEAARQTGWQVFG